MSLSWSAGDYVIVTRIVQIFCIHISAIMTRYSVFSIFSYSSFEYFDRVMSCCMKTSVLRSIIRQGVARHLIRYDLNTVRLFWSCDLCMT